MKCHIAISFSAEKMCCPGNKLFFYIFYRTLDKIPTTAIKKRNAFQGETDVVIALT